MIKLIIEFDKTIYIKFLNSKNLIHDTILDLFLSTIDKDYSYDLQENINNYYFLNDNKLIQPDTSIKKFITKGKPEYYIKCYRKQKGGDMIGDAIMDGITSMFKPFIDPVMAIVNIVILLIKFIEFIINFIIWFVEFLLWLFLDLLNPKNFVSEFGKTLLLILYTIFSSIFNILFAFVALSVNTVGGWMQGFWGWDQSSITKVDRDSNYFKKMQRSKGKKCYLTSSNTVPFSILLGTILCPPIGVFMDMGLTGWLNIIICILLTLLFYLPGLVYALLIIYS
jgi:uncharacterized membrane protein YqaE (UPF0057 family)